MADSKLNSEFELIAILRGVAPVSVMSVAEQLLESGIKEVEIPLNSPQALHSIEILADEFGDRLALGAGTVLQPNQVSQIKQAGAKYILTPNTNPKVIEQCVTEDIPCFAGFSTATEALTALDTGAEGLKLFPAANFGVGYLKAIQAVLPNGTAVYAVGGITLDNMLDWVGAANGVGVGSSLYSPHINHQEFTARCKAFSAKLQGIKQNAG